MVQVIRANNTKSNFSRDFAKAIGTGFSEGLDERIKRKNQLSQLANENKAIKENFDIDLSNINDPDLRKAYFTQEMKNQGKLQQLNQKQEAFGKIFNRDQGQAHQPQDKFGLASQSARSAGIPQEQQQQQQQGTPNQGGFDASQLSDQDILELTNIDPNMGRQAQHAKDVALREKTSKQKFDFNKEKEERDKFEADRSYHTGFSKESDKQANSLRESLPKKEMSLNYARQAVESGDIGYFSPDKLADATGVDLFRTAKGAQLITAGKENLLSNMSRVSAKGQNQWFEQRLNSMFAKIGQSEEANLTVQEMLEGELAIDQAYLSAFDNLASQDQEKYGFEKKDIEKRARNFIKPYEKEVMNRSSYRMKQLEEKEKGLNKMQAEVGKNVIKGTPLTMAMANLYVKKFGKEKALSVAEKNGYKIPTKEEFMIYTLQPQEYREKISE